MAKLLSKLVVWAVIVLQTVFNLIAQQPKKTSIKKDCIRPLLPENHALVDSLLEYLSYVGNYEIPVIAMQISGDTTHYYITAFVASYMIKQNPPTTLVRVNNREALFYSGKKSIAQTAPACYNFIIKKYSRLLHIDKLNRKEGRAPSYKYQGFSYDPIMGDIFITKDGRIGTKHAKKIPFIRYD